MAQTGYTPILIYSSSTAAAAPAAGSLTNSTLGSELAINITDGKLFYKDNANAVQVIGWKVVPTSAGGTGLTSYTAGDLVYYASGTAFTKLAIGTSGRYLSSSGTAPQWSAPAALTKTDDTNVTLTLGGSASTALLNAASITVGWSGTLAASRGGTGVSSFGGTNRLLYTTATDTLSSITTANTSALITNSTGVPAWTSGSTANRVLRTDGTTVSFAQVALGTDVSGTLPVANSLLYYNTGEKTMSSGSGNVDWYSIAFGSFTGRSCRVEVVFSLISGSGGSRIWFRNSLVVETGGAALTETNLNANNGGNGTLSFVLSGATLTVRTTSSIASNETARMSILVSGRDMTSTIISVL